MKNILIRSKMCLPVRCFTSPLNLRWTCTQMLNIPNAVRPHQASDAPTAPILSIVRSKMRILSRCCNSSSDPPMPYIFIRSMIRLQLDAVHPHQVQGQKRTGHATGDPRPTRRAAHLVTYGNYMLNLVCVHSDFGSRSASPWLHDEMPGNAFFISHTWWCRILKGS